MNSKSHRIYRFGPYLLEPDEARLKCDGEEIALTPTVLKLLTELVKHSPHLRTHEQLLEAIWPDSEVEESNITVSVTKLKKVIPKEYIQTVPRHGYRFIQKVTVMNAAGESRFHTDSGSGTPTGALPLGSDYYLDRPVDCDFRRCISSGEIFALVKGAPQTGKTSLLVRGLQSARECGAQVVFTDFQKFTSTQCESLESLLHALAASIAESLDLDPPGVWNSRVGANSNFETYLLSEVLTKLDGRLVWGMDEIDRLFDYPYHSDVFGLFRSWHTARAFEPSGPWRQFTLALTYATEAHLFISNLNQSPFNVGTQLLLEDFTLAEVSELNERCGRPLPIQDLPRYREYTGGQPYLVNFGLHMIREKGLDLAGFEAQADSDDGLFSDHLRRLLLLLEHDPGLLEAARTVLTGVRALAIRDFYRLRSAGFVSGASPKDARPRCEMYARYLEKRLL